mgnify:CR=1 FL=1
MPISASDIKIKLSIKTGSAGNAAAQSDTDESLGKYISTTEIIDATVHNIFDQISGDENAASTVEYRCFFVHNAHATLTLQGAIAWISAEVAGGATAAFGVDTTAASAVGSAPAQALEVVNETTAPAGVSFSTATTKGTGITIGNITAGQCRAIWLRRTAANSAAANNDGVTISVEGDTGA